MLWAIPQATYHINGGTRWQETDPAWPQIAAPLERDPLHKAASWQKIIDTLTDYADRILAPRTPA
ncbi:hypothetical protein ACFYTQ_28140 [Nocardia sp. NPDC004068]|uniref:hypothetical protein n=1 Tax=Nocardia sp. NPDC004068 TaxID=3364303 RepID=UPI0036AB8F3A